MKNIISDFFLLKHVWNFLKVIKEWKILAYGRHWISQAIWIVSPLPWRGKKLYGVSKYFFCVPLSFWRALKKKLFWGVPFFFYGQKKFEGAKKKCLKGVKSCLICFAVNKKNCRGSKKMSLDDFFWWSKLGVGGGPFFIFILRGSKKNLGGGGSL